MMFKVLILVEGQTEESFINNVLAEHLKSYKVQAIAIVFKTKQTRYGKNEKGGGLNYKKVHRELMNLLRDSSATLVTTMLDLYQLPPDFPGTAEAIQPTCFLRATHLEGAFRKDINHPRFYPYFAIHEFEALLFSNPEKFDILPEVKAKHIKSLEKIATGFKSPEEINDTDPPAKRIEAIIRSYRKRADGTRISKEIGIPSMRKNCQHFNEWLTTLENLGSR